jgi:hypothetical protein
MEPIEISHLSLHARFVADYPVTVGDPVHFNLTIGDTITDVQGWIQECRYDPEVHDGYQVSAVYRIPRPPRPASEHDALDDAF